MNQLCSHSIPENVFSEFMYLPMKWREFSLNDIMYSEIDRVSIGKTLGSVLANIFLGVYESFFLNNGTRPMFLIAMVILFRLQIH